MVIQTDVAVQLLSQVRLLETAWIVARQAHLGTSRQEYWSGLPSLSPGDLSNPGIKLMSPAWQGDSLPQSHLGSPISDYMRCNRRI